jgi:glutathione S-transferase
MQRPDLAEQLCARIARDDEVRARLASERALGGYHPEMEAVHRDNATWLRAVVEQVGWPGRDAWARRCGWRSARVRPMKLYGAPMGSATRSRWMLEETGVPYDFELVNLRDEAGRAAFLQIHPGGKIPYLIDGDVRLFESLAINFYLAEKYAPALLPSDVAERARMFQWSLWAITNLQPETLQFLRHTMMLPTDQRDPAQAEAGRKGARRYLDQLEAAMEGDYLIGDRFTAADLNCGSCVQTPLRLGIEAGPKVTAWVDRLRARPAFKKAYST